MNNRSWESNFNELTSSNLWGIYVCLKTSSFTMSSAVDCPCMFLSEATIAILSKYSCRSMHLIYNDGFLYLRAITSILFSLMVKSTTKSNSSLTVITHTPFLLKKSVMLVQSLRRNSSACGWSCSTDCDTSMMNTFPSWYLNDKIRNFLLMFSSC